MPRVFDLMEVGFSPIQSKHVGAQALLGDFNSLTATGNNSQANAYQIEANYNIFTTVGASTNSAKLPKAESDPHGVYHILNLGANPLYLFPFLGDSFNNLSADTAVLLPVGTGVILVKQTITSWQVQASFGANPVPVFPVSSGWTITNETADRVLDCNATTINELADVLGTLITDLIAGGILDA